MFVVDIYKISNRNKFYGRFQQNFLNDSKKKIIILKSGIKKKRMFLEPLIYNVNLTVPKV